MDSTDDRRLDEEAILAGFDAMGRYLRVRGAKADIAVYGGTAILLQFDWRTITQDVDAVTLGGCREELVKAAAEHAGARLGLPDAWLNNAVGGFTPLEEEDDFFVPLGDFPRDGHAALRVVLAKPEYLCAMKLKALERADPQDKDFRDAVRLAEASGVDDERELSRMFSEFFPDEDLPPIAAARLVEVADGAARGAQT